LFVCCLALSASNRRSSPACSGSNPRVLFRAIVDTLLLGAARFFEVEVVDAEEGFDGVDTHGFVELGIALVVESTLLSSLGLSNEITKDPWLPSSIGDVIHNLQNGWISTTDTIINNNPTASS